MKKIFIYTLTLLCVLMMAIFGGGYGSLDVTTSACALPGGCMELSISTDLSSNSVFLSMDSLKKVKVKKLFLDFYNNALNSAKNDMKNKMIAKGVNYENEYELQLKLNDDKTVMELYLSFKSQRALEVFCDITIPPQTKKKGLFYYYYTRDLSSIYNAVYSEKIKKYESQSNLVTELGIEGLTQTQIESLCVYSKAFYYATQSSRIKTSQSKKVSYLNGYYFYQMTPSSDGKIEVTLLVPRCEIWMSLVVALALVFIGISYLIVYLKKDETSENDKSDDKKLADESEKQ